MRCRDRLGTAAIAHEAGIQTYYAGLKPDEKVRHIRRLRVEVDPVAMVGDGINDVPALVVENALFTFVAPYTDRW